MSYKSLKNLEGKMTNLFLVIYVGMLWLQLLLHDAIMNEHVWLSVIINNRASRSSMYTCKPDTKLIYRPRLGSFSGGTRPKKYLEVYLKIFVEKNKKVQYKIGTFFAPTRTARCIAK